MLEVIDDLGCLATSVDIVVEMLTGLHPIEDLPAIGYTPNLSSGWVTGHFPTVLSTVDIQVYTVTGQVVWQRQIEHPTAEIRLDLHHLSAGTYFIRTEIGDDIFRDSHSDTALIKQGEKEKSRAMVPAFFMSAKDPEHIVYRRKLDIVG